MIAWDWTLDGWVLAVGLLSACSCALLGNYLVLRRLSLMGDAISHAVLPGLAVAFLWAGSRDSWTMFFGAVVAGALTALLTQIITDHGKVEHGAAMGVVFSVLFAAGLVLIRRAADHVDLDPGCVLYCNIDHIPLDALGEAPSPFLSLFGIEAAIPPAARRLAGVLLLNVLFVMLFYKELKITSFDPALATTLGIRSSVMHYALMVMVAVTTVANFEAVGSILVIAMLIVPPVVAHLLTDRLPIMIGLSLVVAAVSAAGGQLLSLFGPSWIGATGSVSTAGAMAVAAGFMLILTIVFSPSHGLIARAYNRAALATRIIMQDVLGLLFRWGELSGEGRAPMPLQSLQVGLGSTRPTRRALRSLRRRGQIQFVPGQQGQVGLVLTESGVREASAIIGSHRLWETFLARNFALETDHLHAPAERMEHYITPELREALRHVLVQPARDPQGKPIPDSDRRGSDD